MTTREDCMSEMQKQFEQFCINLGQGLDLRNTSCGFEMYTNNYTQKAWRAWQACAAHYEAEQSKDYAEWIDERNTLLALIAEKDAALETVKNSGLLNGSFTLHDEIYDVVYEALSLTHDSVRLVKVESYDDMVCGDGPIYTIVKGE